MFTIRERATLLAALQFWKEEITQSGDFAARPYFKLVGMKKVRPLNSVEIMQLATKLGLLPIENNPSNEPMDD